MKDIDKMAIDIATTNNSFYTNQDIPEIKKILLQAQENGELETVRLNLKHSAFKILASKGYPIAVYAYEQHKKYSTNHHTIAPASRIETTGDYEGAILARHEEV